MPRLFFVSGAELAAVLVVLHSVVGLTRFAAGLALGLWLLLELASSWLVWPLLCSDQPAVEPKLSAAFLERSFLWCFFVVGLGVALWSCTPRGPLVALLEWLILLLPLATALHVLLLAHSPGGALAWVLPQSPEHFRQRYLQATEGPVLAGLCATLQMLLLFAALVHFLLPQTEAALWPVLRKTFVVQEALWLGAAVLFARHMGQQATPLGDGGLQEKGWRNWVWGLLLWPSRFALVHALLGLGALGAGLGGLSLQENTPLEARYIGPLCGLFLQSETVAVLWLGVWTRKKLRPLFPWASQQLSLRALFQLRPPPIAGQAMLLLAAMLVGWFLLFLPSWLPLVLLLTLGLALGALVLSFLHRRLLGRLGDGGVTLGREPTEQLRSWLDLAENSVLGQALQVLWEELTCRMTAVEEAAHLLEQKVNLRTTELQLRHEQLARTLAELAQVQGQLVETEKHASVGRLLANVTHEINNPVNAMTNAAAPLAELVSELSAALSSGQKLAAAEFADFGEKFDQMLQVTERGLARTTDIVRGLTDSSAQPSRPAVVSPVVLRTCLQEAWSLCQKPAGLQIEVHWQLADLAPVWGDEGHLQQVFLNLFVNAVHALAERGKQETAPPPPALWVRTTAQKPGQLVEITDNGIGMTEPLLRRLFEPFFSTKEASQGSGLGLAIAHGLVAQHQGRISVTSKPGFGSTFSVWLPKEALRPSASMPASAHPDQPT